MLVIDLQNCSIESMLQFSELIRNHKLITSPIRRIMELAEEKYLVSLHIGTKDVISFAGGWVNHETPAALRLVYEKIVRNNTLFHASGAYSATGGTAELREILAKLSGRIYGVEGIGSKNFLVGQSATQLILAVLITILNPDDKILVFDPTYTNFLEQALVCQRENRIISVPVFDQKLWSFKKEKAILVEILQILEKKHPKLIFFASPDNPTGRIFSDTFVTEVLRNAEKVNCFVMVDFAYRDLWYTENVPGHFSFSPVKFSNLLKIYSASKWLRSLGRRIGWLEASPEVVEAVKYVQQTMILSPDTLHQMALCMYLRAALDDGSLDKYLDELRIRYHDAADYTCACIDKYWGLRYVKPDGGLYVVVDVGEDSERFVDRVMRDAGVIFVPGGHFGNTLGNGIRISFGPHANNLGVIEKGLQKVSKKNL